MSLRHQSLAILFCAVTVQGCQNSSATDGNSEALDPVSEPGAPADDGDGSQRGEGVAPLVDGLPDEDPVPVESVGPEGDSNLSVDGRLYPLKSALGDIWGETGEHFNVNFTLANGMYQPDVLEVSGRQYDVLTPVATSALFYARMYSPGDQFSLVTYSYSPFGDGGGVLAGNAFFADAHVGVDEDLSGDVEDDEKRMVVGGTIDFTGTLPYIELHFSVTLEDGQLVKGHYTGLFDFTRR
ncbi:hypothetical protein ACUNV4_13170 [Granulosicoccus sp. 3-233]|uniref:hypothetical protein n=1 Tax=Granulosicoccus sp. 3-233 TaxID=3417969 RepID=UPI003D3576C3